jgi:hypothetical protein
MAWLTQPIPGLTREYLETHRLRALEEEAAYMARHTWAAASSEAAAHVTLVGNTYGRDETMPPRSSGPSTPRGLIVRAYR